MILKYCAPCCFPSIPLFFFSGWRSIWALPHWENRSGEAPGVFRAAEVWEGWEGRSCLAGNIKQNNSRGHTPGEGGEDVFGYFFALKGTNGIKLQWMFSLER